MYDFSTISKQHTFNRIELMKIIIYKNSYCIEEKLPERFRVILLKSGAGTMLINGKTIPYIAPALICLNEQALVGNLSDADAEVFYFHPSALNRNLDFENIRSYSMDAAPEVIENRLLFRLFAYDTGTAIFNHLGPEVFLHVQQLFSSIKEQLDEQLDCWWPCRARSYLAELLFYLVKIDDISTKNKMKIVGALSDTVSMDFKPVLDFLLRSYSEKLTLDDIAKEVGTNRTTLNAKFKKETGLSAIAWLIDFRLRIASTMLIDTELPVSEIAERIGMTDSCHFERLFRKKYAMTPKAYRSATKS